VNVRNSEVGERASAKPTIAVVDYGAGNLTSVLKGLAAAGADPHVAHDPGELASAAAIVVPGVGHFAATESLNGTWRETILERVRAGIPLLGICLGLQYLFEGSSEAPLVPGLGLLGGRCTLLPPTQKIPHVGWNTLRIVRPSRLLADVPDGSSVYFTHSYGAPVTDACVAETEYTARFAAAVEHQNVFGVQFHPEKSGDVGLRVLRNFASLVNTRNPLSNSPTQFTNRPTQLTNPRTQFTNPIHQFTNSPTELTNSPTHESTKC
jgi:imidazole glycerol-phosphate synthase subunit HisH